MWDGKPGLACGPNEVWMASTCPCAGAAYAEIGHMLLVRLREGRPIEHLDLRPLFRANANLDSPGEDVPFLQRWPAEDGELAREDRDDPTLVSDIERRAAPELMRFSDYARTGVPTTFSIQIGTLPCGKLQFAAVGVTRANPSLHVLSTTAKPAVPLIMAWPAWQALLSGPGPHTVPTWDCGDHGSERYAELVVQADRGQISVKQRQFSCTPDQHPGELLSQTDQ